MQLDLAFVAAVAAIVTALTQALKAAPAIAERKWLLPILAIVLGIALSAVGMFVWPPGDLGGTGPWIGWMIVHGIVAGLSACGLYSAVAKPAMDAATKK